VRVPCSVFGASHAATSTAANLQHSTVGMDPKVCRLSSVVCNARERARSAVAHHGTEQDAKDAVEPAEAYAASTRGSGCECTIGRASGRECEGCYYTRLGVRIRWNGRVHVCPAIRRRAVKGAAESKRDLQRHVAHVRHDRHLPRAQLEAARGACSVAHGMSMVYARGMRASGGCAHRAAQ